MIDARGDSLPPRDDEEERDRTERVEPAGLFVARPRRTDLPMSLKGPEIHLFLQSRDKYWLVAIGETGSGKTTQIPQIAYEVMNPEGEPRHRLAVTQPRIFAVKSTAERVGIEMGSKMGAAVGYQNKRLDPERLLAGDRINFMVDGTLLRKLQSDITLSDYSMVMIDEVHERSINIDLVLGLLKRAQKARAAKVPPMAPLKILITSATLNEQKLDDYLSDVPTEKVKSEGRQHDIDDHYLDPGQSIAIEDMPQKAAERAKALLERPDSGDILIFMPGRGEIEETIAHLRALGMNEEEVDLLPLYSQLPPEEQNKVHNTQKRKIIVSTNIAETSVTIDPSEPSKKKPFHMHVIDSGWIRQTEVDEETGFERVKLVKHARSGTKQRRGRAGRTGSGEYWALFEKDESDRLEDQTPEILRSNLSRVVLTLKKAKVDDVRNFEYIDRPPDASFDTAIATLQRLGALDEQEKLTSIGELMAEFPVDPYAARLIVEAMQSGRGVAEACTMAAFLENDSVFASGREEDREAREILKAVYAKELENRVAGFDEREKRMVVGSDFFLALQVWEDYEQHKDDENWLAIAEASKLNLKTLKAIADLRIELLERAGQNGQPSASPQPADVISLNRAIVKTFSDNILEIYEQGSGQEEVDASQEEVDELRAEGNYTVVRTQTPAKLDHASILYRARERLMVVGQLQGSGKKGLLRGSFCHPASLDGIYDTVPELIEMEQRRPEYYGGKDKVEQQVALNLKGGESSGEYIRDVPPQVAADTFAYWMASGYDKELDFIRLNKEYIDVKGIPHNALWQFYKERIGLVSSKVALKALVASGEVDFIFKLDVDGVQGGGSAGGEPAPPRAAAGSTGQTDAATGATGVKAVAVPSNKRENIIRRGINKIKKGFRWVQEQFTPRRRQLAS